MTFTGRIMRRFDSSESWEGNHSNHRNPKYQLAGCWHEKRSCQARRAVIWPCWLDGCNCIQLGLSLDILPVWIEQQRPRGRVPTLWGIKVLTRTMNSSSARPHRRTIFYCCYNILQRFQWEPSQRVLPKAQHKVLYQKAFVKGFTHNPHWDVL